MTTATTGSSGDSSPPWARRSSGGRPPADAVAAVGWWNLLARLGLPLPLVVVHDFGLVLSGGRSAFRREVMRDGAPGGGVLARYQALLARFAEAETIEELGTTPLGDETLAVILARIVGDIYMRWHGRSRLPETSTLPLSAPAYESARAELARLHDPAWALPFIQRLCEQERTLLARLQQIELSAVRLFGLFPSTAPAADLADLFHVVGTAGAADVVDFSLQLMPSLLETKRRPGAQRFSIDGYASVERRGKRRCAPAQRAGPRRRRVRAEGAVRRPALLRARAPERGRAPAALHPRRRQRVDARRPRGVRARAGAGAGEEAVAGRREDRRRLGALLRQPPAPAHRSRPVGAARSAAAAQLSLAARAELRARVRRSWPSRSAAWCATRGARSRSRSSPTATVRSRPRRSRRWRAQARLYGIFVLPSGPLELDYLPLLHKSQVVTAGVAGARTADKRRRALEIVEEAARGASVDAPPTEQIQTRQCAEQALRKGRPREALALYRQAARARQDRGRALRGVARGTAAAYLALGRGREAGYVLLALGRFAEAQRHFPVEGAAARVGVLRRRIWAGGARRRGSSPRWGTRRWPRSSWRPAGRRRRPAWSGSASCATSGSPGGRTRPRWRTSTWARRCCASAIARAACACSGRRRRMLEVVADDFETGGETRARVRLLQRAAAAGKGHGIVRDGRRGLPEHDPDHRRLSDSTRAVQYYDDFIAHAVENKELYAAAMAAREVAEYSLRLGLAWDRHYLERAAQLWIETARANQSANGPVDLSANAYQAAIDAATRWAIWRWPGRSTPSSRSCR